MSEPFHYDHSDLREASERGEDRGIIQERERIIKLLEAEQLHDPDVIECHCGSWREAVELIKGENK